MTWTPEMALDVVVRSLGCLRYRPNPRLLLVVRSPRVGSGQAFEVLTPDDLTELRRMMSVEPLVIGARAR